MSPEARARQLMLATDYYRDITPEQQVAMIDIPLHAHRAFLVDDRMFFTTMRPEGLALTRLIEGLTPQPMDWIARGPHPWVVDMAAEPDVPVLHIPRMIGATLVRAGLCEDGAWVYYRRHSGRRFGRTRARDGRFVRGRWRRHADGGPRSLVEHAGVDGGSLPRGH